jgi:nucleotide-binding universal stress UspA family protein
MQSFSTILFATDFSENSDLAFDYALTLARQSSAHLVVIHVINEPVDLRGFYVPHISFDNLEKEIEDGANRMMEKFCESKLGDYSAYETKICTGVPHEEILKQADERNASLIVLGTHGRSGLDHILFGSTAERVVRQAKCPVLTVRLAE